MTQVIVFHHAQGLTDGIEDFAHQLRGAGHLVSTPDLYYGATFDTLAEGLAHVEDVGLGAILERGRLAAESVPEGAVYAGFSLGVLPAQLLAQTRRGAAGALLMHSCVPPAELGSAWPVALPVQIHAMADDPLFVGEGDLQAARDVVGQADHAELFLYDGDRHLFADSSLPDYDEAACGLMMARVLQFLDQVG